LLCFKQGGVSLGLAEGVFEILAGACYGLSVAAAAAASVALVPQESMCVSLGQSIYDL
jgi:hypothetical protein